MCLGIPGRVTRIDKESNSLAMGKVDFGGISKDVCLAYVPEVKIGDYVIVHVGFAISILNEEEAGEISKFLERGVSPRESTAGSGTAYAGTEDA